VTNIVCYTTVIFRLKKRPNGRKALVAHSTLKKDFELKVNWSENTSEVENGQEIESQEIKSRDRNFLQNY
jgi:hypothetical protein